MRDVFPHVLAETLERPLLLEEMGIVRSAALRQASTDYGRHGDAFTRVNLYYTLQTELWLRQHLSDRPPVDGHRAPMAATSTGRDIDSPATLSQAARTSCPQNVLGSKYVREAYG
jgi:hypothetical protein